MLARTALILSQVCLLSACISNANYRPNESTHIDDMNYFPQSYSTVYYNEAYQQPYREVIVPNSYYAGSQSPISHKDQDRFWVTSQNPHSYTIEIADGEKRSQVAKQLIKAPKSDRTAQIQYQRAGKIYYKGVYGSFNSQEEAEKALNNLPGDLKQNAGIKSWGSIQANGN